MKKIFFIATLALIILSSNLFTREPKFILYKNNGQVVQVGGDVVNYMGYNSIRVETHGILFWRHHHVSCFNPGYEHCVAIIGGTAYDFVISDINNPDITNNFNQEMITNITNELLDEVEKSNIKGDLSGNLSRNYSLTDLKGITYNVNFTIVYELKDVGNGEINVYINTFNL